ncbi:MAG: DUF5320 domain-containing protein [Nanobdellota archaeon]
MPRGDGTGPGGMGSRTGRGMGYCNGYNTPGFANPGFRRGLGRGFGRNSYMNPRGFVRPRFNQPVPTKEQEKEMLQEELKQVEEDEKFLKEDKESLKKRLNEMD